MTIRDLRIGSYVNHKGILHLVTAISASHNVYIQPRMAKIHLQVPVEDLKSIELTGEIFKQLKFETNGDHYVREQLFITNTRSYPAYLKNPKGERVSIGMCVHLHQLQNIYFDLYNDWLILP